jgi:hypothetical protein
MRPVFSLLFTAALAGACASDRPPREATAFVVMEENATIPNRHAIRRTHIIDNDVLLIETRPGQLFRVELFAPCVARADWARTVRIETTQARVDRFTRFRVGNRTCSVRTITRVERAPQAAG